MLYKVHRQTKTTVFSLCRSEINTLLSLERVRLGSIQIKNNWNNASKRLFGSYSHFGIPGFPFGIFCLQEQNGIE